MPLLKMRGIEKRFPGVHALRGVDLEVERGEVLALVGENGAGKSTLIKILAGAQAPDSGTIEMDGVPQTFRSPIDAQRAGIAVIYQEFNLIPALSVRANVLLANEKTRCGWIRAKDEYAEVAALFGRIGLSVDPDTLCRDLSVAQQQMVEIAKALAVKAKLLVMDEPTAALSAREVDKLLALMRELRAQGLGIIYISHRLEEIFQVADRVTVLRDGQYVGTRPVRDIARGQLIEMMVGRKLDQEFPKRSVTVGAERLVVRNLSRHPQVKDVSFSVRAGEVLGFTGLVGAGRTETARLIFGADRRDSGTIELDGKPLTINKPRDAIRARIALLTEDRKAQGLVLLHGARENFALPNLFHFTSGGLLQVGKERNTFADYVGRLGIRLGHMDQLARNLSGGNQQKVVLAKWLERNCEVVIFDEPTRGIDVGAKYEVYGLINALAAEGKAIIMISSELPEILGMSDRIVVMHEGRIAGEITDVTAASQQKILELALGGVSTAVTP